MTTPSLTNPNPKREDEREARATIREAFESSYRDRHDRWSLSGRDFHLSETGDFYAADHIQAEFRAFANGYRAAASARPSPGDPVREALEKVTRAAWGAGLFETPNPKFLRAVADHLDGGPYLENPKGSGRCLRGRADLLDAAVPVGRAALSVSTPTGEGEDEGLRRACVPDVPASDHLDYLGEVIAQYVTNVGVLADAGGAIDAVRAALAHPQQGGEREFKDGYEKGVLNYIGSVSYAANMELSKQRAWDEYSAPTSPSKSSGEEA